MSRVKIPTNASLLAVVTCFCSFSLNGFIFILDIKVITLYDLVALFGLQPDRKDIDPTFNIDTISINSIIIKSIDYATFIKSYCHRKDKVTQAKHVAFIFTWINKYISCNQSKKVTKIYLSTVVTIVIGAKVSLASFVLSHIFKGMNDLVFMEDGKLNGTARGLIWMV